MGRKDSIKLRLCLFALLAAITSSLVVFAQPALTYDQITSTIHLSLPIASRPIRILNPQPLGSVIAGADVVCSGSMVACGARNWLTNDEVLNDLYCCQSPDISSTTAFSSKTAIDAIDPAQPTFCNADEVVCGYKTNSQSGREWIDYLYCCKTTPAITVDLNSASPVDPAGNGVGDTCAANEVVCGSKNRAGFSNELDTFYCCKATIAPYYPTQPQIQVRCSDNAASTSIVGANFDITINTNSLGNGQYTAYFNRLNNCGCEGIYGARGFVPSSNPLIETPWTTLYQINYDTSQQSCQSCIAGYWDGYQCHGDDSSDEADYSARVCQSRSFAYDSSVDFGSRCCGDDNPADCGLTTNSNSRLCRFGITTNDYSWSYAPPNAEDAANCMVYDVGCGLFSAIANNSQWYGCKSGGNFNGPQIPDDGLTCKNHHYLCFRDSGTGSIAECYGRSSPYSNTPSNKPTGSSVVNENDGKTYYCTPYYRWTSNLDAVEDAPYDSEHDAYLACENAKNPDGTSQNLKWTGEYCCGEDDDKELLESYNDPSGTTSRGICFLNTFYSNNQYFNYNNYQQKEVYITNGTMYGCAIDHENAGGNNSMLQYEPAKPYFSYNDWLFGYADNPDPGGANINNGLLVKDQKYCTILDTNRDSIANFYCSYNETWVSTNQNRTHLSYFPWNPIDQYQQRAECCLPDQCWDGNACVLSQQENPNQQPYQGKYLCLDGKWVESFPKSNWDYSKSGNCMLQSQCLVDPAGNPVGSEDWYSNPQCINSTDYLLDYYCDDGNWSSRTKLVAERLLAMKGTHDYTLFCDNYENVVNYCNYQLLDIPLLQADVCDIFLSGVKTGAITNECKDMAGNNVPCANNVCVLRFDDDSSKDTYDTVAVGMSLNQPVNATITNILKVFNVSRQACDNVAGNDFDDCNSNGKMFYNRAINSIIFVKKSSTDTSLLNEVYGWLKYRLQRIIEFVSGLEPHDYTFIRRTSLFSQLFMSEQGNHLVFGIKERKHDGNGFVNYLAIDFYGFASDICQTVKANDCYLGDNGKQTIFASAYDGESNHVLDNWVTLTSKLRVQAEGPSLVAASGLSCAIRQSSCNADETAVLRISNNNNAELPDYTNYNNVVCCKSTYPNVQLTTQCDSRLNSKVLRLSSETGATVEKNHIGSLLPGTTEPAYPFNACLSSPRAIVKCTYFDDKCDRGYEPLASISADTNALVGNYDAYNTKVCCRAALEECTSNGATEQRDCGLGVCANGIQTRSCSAGTWGPWSACSTANLAVPENSITPDPCNGDDDDCDGVIDNGLTFDIDRDGFTTTESCSGTKDDCNDNNALVNLNATETCDGTDNDCNNTVDDNCALGFTQGNCPSNSKTVLKLSDPTNAHASYANDQNFEYSLCWQLDDLQVSIRNGCNADEKYFISLSGPETPTPYNEHFGSSINYLNDVCLKSDHLQECYISDDCGADTCLIKLSNPDFATISNPSQPYTDSHAAPCSDELYQAKVCCKLI